MVQLIHYSFLWIKKCPIFAFYFINIEMKINFSLIFYCFCMLLLASCAKDEGEGGTSTIKGKLFEKTYDNSFQNLLAQGASPDENVYIIYGGKSN